MAKKSKRTSDAVEILHRRFYEGKPRRMASLERERVSASIARQIYDMRIGSGLSQKELAELVGTTASVISRLENADYGGHSVGMLERIGTALNSRLEVKFVKSGFPGRIIPRITSSEEFASTVVLMAEEMGYKVETCTRGKAKGSVQIDFGHKKLHEHHLKELYNKRVLSGGAKVDDLIESVAPGRPCTHKAMKRIIASIRSSGTA